MFGLSVLGYALDICFINLSVAIPPAWTMTCLAARTRIVDGAVGMVKLAIDQLESESVGKLAEADRGKLVINLMPVLVSDTETQPVLNVGKE